MLTEIYARCEAGEVASRFTIEDTEKTISCYHDDKKCWMKAGFVLGDIVEVIIMSEGIDIKRVLENSIESTAGTENGIPFTWNDSNYVIDTDALVALFEKMFTQRTRIILKSPFDTEDFEDRDYIIYDRGLGDLLEEIEALPEIEIDI